MIKQERYSYLSRSSLGKALDEVMMLVAASVANTLATLTLCKNALQLSATLFPQSKTSFTSHLVHGLQATSGMQAVCHPQRPVQPYLNR